MGWCTVKTMITYAEGIYQAIRNTDCSDRFINEGVDELVNVMRSRRVFFIGNGGSGACCDHMANDLCLTEKATGISLTNTNNITCIANDFGFDQIFAKQLEWLRTDDDYVLIAMSCSGKSANIIKAIEYAKSLQMYVVTLTGKEPDNPMRDMGNLNFYVPSQSYGVVQIAHEAIIHCAIDKLAGLY